MAVRNWISSNHEKILFIAPDGKKYNLHDPYKRSILRMTGWGMPTAEIASTRGPYQHGANPLSIRMPVRSIAVEIRHSGCDRDEYWDMRASLLDALRLNRSSLDNPVPGNLRWYRSNGTIRQLDVLVSDGPRFDPTPDVWDSFGYRDVITFTAFNPIIYEPDENLDSFADLGCTPTGRLQFPFFFGPTDIIFGATSCNAVNNLTINYTGTWQTFPQITVIGPATNFSITHLGTGDIIEFENYTINAGDSAVFDLTYGVKTITLTSSGASLLGYISTESNLGTFAIEPDPIVANGVNNFEVSIYDGNGDTRVLFSYYTRYIGI